MQTVVLGGPTYDAYESISVSSTAVILTVATYGPRPYAFITVETAPIRFTLDGTDPVAATTGELANPGDVIELFGDEVIRFEFINETGLASSLKCHGARGWRGEA